MMQGENQQQQPQLLQQRQAKQQQQRSEQQQPQQQRQQRQQQQQRRACVSLQLSSLTYSQQEEWMQEDWLQPQQQQQQQPQQPPQQQEQQPQPQQQQQQQHQQHDHELQQLLQQQQLQQQQQDLQHDIHHHQGTDAAAGGPPLKARLPWPAANGRGWEAIEVVGSLRPERRSGAASCVYKNSLFVFGGYGGLSRLGNLFKFDFCTSRWREIKAPGCPSPRESNGAVVLGEKMFVFGGYSGTHWLNDLHAFDLEKEEWTEVAHWGMKPSPRFGYVAAANVLKPSILLFGGYDGTNWLNDLNEFDPKTLKWTPISQRGLIPSGRSCPASAMHEQGLFLFGGYNGVERLSDLFRFDLLSEVWTVITTYSGLPRGAPQPGQFCCWGPPAASGAVDDEEVAAAVQPLKLQQRRSPSSNSNRSNSSSSSGCGCSALAYTAYSSSSRSSSGSSSSICCSSSKHSGGPAARYFHAACAKDGKLFAFGGYSGRERLNDFYELDLETYEWRFIDGGRLLPSGRSSMVGVIFKNNFVVFGGYDGREVLSDFYRFPLDPLSPPPSTLLTNLLSLQAPTPLSDAVFIVEGRIMHSSRALLACRSEHFRALFFGGLKEANDRENKPIPIEGIRHEVFAALLDYLHTDCLPAGLAWPVLVELMVAAERVCVERLKLLCIKRLRAAMCLQSAVQLLAAADHLGIFELKELSLDFLSLHDREIRLNPDVLRPLTKELLLQLFGHRCR